MIRFIRRVGLAGNVVGAHILESTDCQAHLRRRHNLVVCTQRFTIDSLSNSKIILLRARKSRDYFNLLFTIPIFNIVQSDKFLWSTIKESRFSWHCCRTIMVPSQWPKNIGISPALCRAFGTALTSSSRVLKLNHQGQLLERISFLYMSMKHNRLMKSMDTK